VQLQQLNLNRNNIYETGPLQSMTSLEQIYLYNNPVEDFTCPTTANAICFI
jgi:Leucine-rich repeat (LRR) protein